MTSQCGQFPATWSTSCSGNGVCVNSTCYCNAGFTGGGDWARTEGLDCQISIPAQHAIYGVLIGIHTILLLWSTPRSRKAYKRFQMHAAARRKVGAAPSLVENRALVTILLQFLQSPLIILLSIMKIATSMRVGVDVFITIIFFLTRLVIYTQVGLFQPFIFSTLMGKMGGSQTRNVLVAHDRFSGLVFFFVIMAGAGSFAALALDPVSTAYTYILFHGVLLCCMLGFFMQARYLDAQIAQILDASYAVSKKQAILTVKSRLSAAQKAAQIQIASQALLSLICLVPYFYNLYTYFLCWSWATPALFMISIFKTMDRTDMERKIADNNSNSTGAGTQEGANLNNVRNPIREEGHLSSSEMNGSGTVVSSKPPHVYGFELAHRALSEMPSSEGQDGSNAESTTVMVAAAPSLNEEGERGGLAIGISPTMKVLRAMLTPSNKKSSRSPSRSETGAFTFEEEQHIMEPSRGSKSGAVSGMDDNDNSGKNSTRSPRRGKQHQQTVGMGDDNAAE